MAYATVAELRTRINVDDSDDDLTLTLALEAAERAIDEETGRRFSVDGAASARVFSADHEWLLPLRANTIADTTGLVVKVDEDEDGTFETTWASTYYQLEPFNGRGKSGYAEGYTQVRALEDPWPVSARPLVQITADWGWPSVPDPIKDATLMLAAEVWKLKDAPFGVAGFGEFGAVRVRENPLILARIAPFTRRGRGGGVA